MEGEILLQGQRIRNLQRQASGCTDELLEITRDIGKYVIPLCEGENRSMLELQCRLLTQRCLYLKERLEQIQSGLQDAVSSCAADDPWAQGARTTLHVIEQDFLLLDQKAGLLQELLEASERTAAKRSAARKLEDTAEIISLQRILKEERDRCRSGNEESD